MAEHSVQRAGQESGALDGIAVLIPAWEPDHWLLKLVAELLTLSFPAIVIVDDGNAVDGIHACLA